MVIWVHVNSLNPRLDGGTGVSPEKLSRRSEAHTSVNAEYLYVDDSADENAIGGRDKGRVAEALCYFPVV